MSATTYKIRGTRYLRKYTAAAATSIYMAESDAQTVADELCNVPWERSSFDGPAVSPSHNNDSLDENVANRERFDAALFCADHAKGMHRAYANAAFYVFKMPELPGDNVPTVSSVKVRATSDNFNSKGLRIAVHLLDSAELPMSCGVVRAGVAHTEPTEAGVGAVPRIVEGEGANATWKPAMGDVTISVSDATLKRYVAVFVGLENYATSRDNWLEGAGFIAPVVEITLSAALDGLNADEVNDCSVTGTGAVAPSTLLAGGSSPTWLEPPVTPVAGTEAVPLPEGEALRETFFTEPTSSTSVSGLSNEFMVERGWEVKSGAQTSPLSVRAVVAMSGSSVQSVSVFYDASGGAITGSGSVSLSYSSSYDDWRGTANIKVAGSNTYQTWSFTAAVAVEAGTDDQHANVVVSLGVGQPSGQSYTVTPSDYTVGPKFVNARLYNDTTRIALVNDFEISGMAEGAQYVGSGSSYALRTKRLSFVIRLAYSGEALTSARLAYSVSISGTNVYVPYEGELDMLDADGNFVNVVNIDHANGAYDSYDHWALTFGLNQQTLADPDFSDVALTIVSGSLYLSNSSGGGIEQWNYSRHAFLYESSGESVRTRTLSSAHMYQGSSSSGTRCLMLTMAGGAPVDADLCLAQAEGTRLHKTYSCTEVTAGEEWTVAIDGANYSVEYDSDTGRVTLSAGATALGQWTSDYDPGAPSDFFDPCAALYYSDDVAKYGIAAAMADFSAAVATFEGGSQPSDAEMLGRLVRMSKAASGSMSYLHPKTAALADELDAMRPVPRFWRGEAETGPLSCQPGLSVWYHRPETGNPADVDPSTAADGIAWIGGAAKAASVVTNPVFLQLALLALRAPGALNSRIRLANGSTSLDNPFMLRFVAWRSDAALWDKSNSFALSALASMPSVYRSDGAAEVNWQVDPSGTAFPFSPRNVSAERVGVSAVVDGQIAVNDEIEIPLVSPVGEGDVVLIAPEVVGFTADGEASNAYFGRQADPAGAGAEAHNFAWARHAENLGWFPAVTGE